MGAPAKERVTGVDLFPCLAETLNAKKQSVFLLGGNEKAIKLCAVYLIAMNPELVIAGTAHPLIETEGDGLANSEDRDACL